MYKIRVANKISPVGLEMFDRSKYELAEDLAEPDAILVRSANLHEVELPASLKAIARAGSGVNNIPVDRCSERGIAVFNTPGANANGVKELVVAALLMSSRRLDLGIAWTQSLRGEGAEVGKAVEAGKSRFAGPEISGKKLGVIGLGAIGVMVANDALELGMEVSGYDPFVSVAAAWGLSRKVARADTLEQLLAVSDYVTIHVPYMEQTKGMIGKAQLGAIKPGARLVNLARGELVDNEALKHALGSDKLACYVTDFPSAELLGNERIITFPHLGASTPESEENCARMAVKQLCDFLERGNVTNSVNFPGGKFVALGDDARLLVAHANVPGIVSRITAELASGKLNITELLNQHRGELAYTIVDVEGKVDSAVVAAISKIEGVRSARSVKRDS
jgi:D-3-phosphoglycerate dehydrogenase